MDEALIRVFPSKNGGGMMTGRMALQAVAFLIFLVIYAVQSLVPLFADEPDDPALRLLERLSDEHVAVRQEHFRHTLLQESMLSEIGDMSAEISDHRRAVE